MRARSLPPVLMEGAERRNRIRTPKARRPLRSASPVETYSNPTTRFAIRPRSRTTITTADCAYVTRFFETDNASMDFRSHRSCPIDEVAMIEINQILAGMVTAIQSKQFPASSEICFALGLDLSGATITTTQSGIVSILGARLPESTTEIGVVGASTPRRTLDFVFLKPTIPVSPCIHAPFGPDQRVEPSKHGAGLTVAFTIDGVNCGITASEPEGVIETLFCAAQSTP
jgi:hypothetical protein